MSVAVSGESVSTLHIVVFLIVIYLVHIALEIRNDLHRMRRRYTRSYGRRVVVLGGGGNDDHDEMDIGDADTSSETSH